MEGGPASSTLPTTFTSLIEQEWMPSLVASFLSPEEALTFSAACTSTRCVRLLNRTLTREAQRKWHNSSSQYEAHEWQPLCIPPIICAHSVIVKCNWKDQGWGNQKGMLCIVQDGGRAPNDYSPWSPAVVCGREPAPHQLSPLRLIFSPAAAMSYKLWARAGGGGGHSLDVRDLEVRILAYTANADEVARANEAVSTANEALVDGKRGACGHARGGRGVSAQRR